MKRVVLTLMAVLGLLAVPAIAQYEQAPPPEQTTTTEEAVQEERTDPSADSIAPDSGLTLSGTVVSWNDQQLALQTTTGVEHFQLQQNTVRPASFTVGEPVTVDYTRTSQGVMIASQIRPTGAGSAVSSTTTETAPSTTTTTPSAAAPMTPPSTTSKIGDGIDQESELEQDVEEAVDDVGDAADEVGEEISELDEDVADAVDADADDDVDEALPATGGKAPLAALLGLLAIGAAAVLRRL